MASKKPQSARLSAQPFKQWLSRAGALMLVAAAGSLIAMGQSGHPLGLRLRVMLADGAAPILAAAASPIDAIAGAGRSVSDFIRTRAENITLKNQNIQLLQWQAVAKEMEEENRSLRALLHVIPAPKRQFVTAKIIAGLGGPYAHSALIMGETMQSIGKDQAVIDEQGLVGRVVEAGEKSARVLLVTDINSRVPVIAEKSREKSILSGNNDSRPTLTYLASNSKIMEGERLVTSGDGGVFPPGIPVGVVSRIEKGVMSVQPFVDFTQMDYVSVVSIAAK